MPTWAYELIVAADRSALSTLAAERFVAAAQVAIAARGAFAVALSGGSTPRDLYALLASEPWRERVDWARTSVFWGDERAVPPDDPRSNYRLARETLLEAVPLPAENVHRPLAEHLPAATVASDYAGLIGRLVPSEAGVPRFDLVLLGLGDDGHTASLLPASALVHESARLVAVTDREREGTLRVTFTPPLLCNAAALLFLVAGSDKAAALRELLRGEARPDRYPAQVVRQARGLVTLLVDRAAAADLPQALP